MEPFNAMFLDQTEIQNQIDELININNIANILFAYLNMYQIKCEVIKVFNIIFLFFPNSIHPVLKNVLDSYYNEETRSLLLTVPSNVLSDIGDKIFFILSRGEDETRWIF